jgi:hypothetical protein
MVKELVEGSVEWFKSKMKLHDHGLDIIFGKRKGSNGFKLDICCDLDVVARVQESYEVVYQKTKITNGTIGMIFAKVVVFEKGRKDVNWVLYVAQV